MSKKTDLQIAIESLYDKRAAIDVAIDELKRLQAGKRARLTSATVKTVNDVAFEEADLAVRARQDTPSLADQGARK